MTTLFDAFISYGRPDSKAFAIKLHARLLEEGFKVWFDQNDIPLGVDFQNQIDDGIEKAHNFLFIIAPHSVNSSYCRKEIELAIKHNKRIILLLHVEQISWETWQQRNPNCTAEEWEAYKAKGLHTSRDNMHPAIGKINWVYFREGIDDFEAAFAGLINLFRRHADYVEQHTRFLAKALEWERHQKQNSCLLIGEERQQAQSWLKIRFNDEQPPCVPTDLHCEFISESTKNANNLMTQVFLCYSDKDKEVMKKLAKTLRRETFTVWTNKTDIKTGTEFQEEVNKGIEGADNVVCLISPAALQSWYWQQEVAHAFANNKRIIPLLIQPTELDSIHPNIRALQFIDFTTHQDEAKYRDDADKLVKILHEDERYYEEHKILLIKALKWQEQNRNHSILLRGHNLQYYEHWLKLHRHRSEHPPLSLQVEFITESSNQPPESSLEVFISYSRADSDFARKLNEALQIQGKTTWFDQESIPPGSNFQQEIYRGIESSGNFLFVISPRSVNSPYCADEVEYAQKLNKRFVTVLHTEVSVKELHPALASVQWIDFNRHGGEFYPNFSELVRTLDTDREHVKSHTKWSQRALEWENNDKSADLLLRGSECAIAEQWLLEAEQNNKQPAVTDLQKAFIIESRKQQVEEVQRWKELYEKAEQQRRRAEIAEIEALNSLSQALLLSHEQIRGLVATVKAGIKLRDTQTPPHIKLQTVGLLRQAIYEVQECNCLQAHYQGVLGISFSPDGQMLASASEDKTVKLWSRDGTLLRTIKGHEDKVWDVSFSPDGQILATACKDGTVKLWSCDGKELRTLQEHCGSVFGVSFSPDGQMLASASEDKMVKLWSRDGTLLRTIKGHEDKVWDVSFSPDGQILASASEDGTVRLWNLQNKTKQVLYGHVRAVWNVSFSPDGQMLASASRDKTVKLWSHDGNELRTLQGHCGNVFGVSFSPDGQMLASASEDKTVKLWSRDGTLLRTLQGHRGSAFSVSFSPDGQMLASASEDATVKLWRRHKTEMPTFQIHLPQLNSASFSPDGQTIASGNKDGIIKLWSCCGREMRKFQGYFTSITSVSFSPDGQTIVSASDDEMVRLWSINSQEMQVLRGHEGAVLDANFSPDGRMLVSASADGTVKLWNRYDVYANLLKTLQADEESILRVSFSPDSQTIVSASADGMVRLWSCNGTLLNAFQAHHTRVWGVSFSPDGQFLASCSEDKTVKLWHREGRDLQVFQGHQDKVLGVSFSPDGQVIVSFSKDKTVRLWSRNSRESQVLQGHDECILGASFSPDGQTLTSVSVDGVVKFWNFDLEDLLVCGCNWVQDYLKTNPNVSQSDRTH
jgi:WD40 repeat protein